MWIFFYQVQYIFLCLCEFYSDVFVVFCDILSDAFIVFCDFPVVYSDVFVVLFDFQEIFCPDVENLKSGLKM